MNPLPSHYLCLKVYISSMFVKTLHPSMCPFGLTSMILLKVPWLLPNLEVLVRGPIGGFGESFYNLLRFFMEMATISKWCLVHL